jgi:hypothetical protein
MNGRHSPTATRNLQTQYGAFRIEVIIGYYDVFTHGQLPFANFTIKVAEKQSGELQATPNVMIYNSSTKCIEHVCGFGRDPDAAIADAINMLLSEAAKQRVNKSDGELDETDFVWLNWQPYVQLTMPPTG